MSDAGSETETLTRAFLARSLPKAQWTHEAHLRVGLWHALDQAPDAALDRLREAISGHNEATGGANTDQAGYHETITRFYVTLIAWFLARADATRPPDELAAELVATWGARDLPLRYWSRPLLFSTEARRSWVAPDLRPLEWQADDGTAP